MTLPNLRAQNEGPGGGYPPGPCNPAKPAGGSAAAAAVTARLGAAAGRARAALLGLRALGLRALAAARRLAGLAAAAGAVDETQFLGGKITHVSLLFRSFEAAIEWVGTVAGEKRYDSRNHYPEGKIHCPAGGQAAWILLRSFCGPPMVAATLSPA